MSDRDWAEQRLRLDMAVTENGTPWTAPLRRAAMNRGNIALGVRDQVFGLCHRGEDTPTLWIVDRILEPQTLAHFMEFLSHGHLPNGTDSSFPLPTPDEIINITRPLCDWAPAPFNSMPNSARSVMQSTVTHIGSFEDADRLVRIAKDLHAMKSRVWEGIMPLSERRWRDLKLDEPENFPTACKYIVAVINVFCYFNQPIIRKFLRTTFNLISGHFRIAENAINLARQQNDNLEKTPISLLWHEFIKAKYDYSVKKAHAWVIDHIERLRGPLVEELAVYEPSSLFSAAGFDIKQWELTNKLHDLMENATMADTMMFIPTDGYYGDPVPIQQEPAPNTARRGFREQPLTWSYSPNERRQDYITRNRFLSRQEMYNALDPTDTSGAHSLAVTARTQVSAQARARRELRGENQSPGPEKWLYEVRRVSEIPSGSLKWGYVGYRLCHEHSDEQWHQFKAAFDTDISNWGLEHSNIDNIRDLCKIRWLDGKDLGIEDGDIEAARKHFQEYQKSELNEGGFRTSILLVADSDVIKSYLEPKADEGFVLAVELSSSLENGREDESPGYSGSLRILGSLLWDDVGAMLQMQNQRLVDLWPMAMHDEDLIYRGPPIKSINKCKDNSSGELPKEVVAICAIQAALKKLNLVEE